MFSREGYTFNQIFKIFGSNSTGPVTTSRENDQSGGCPPVPVDCEHVEREHEHEQPSKPRMRSSTSTVDVVDYEVRECDTIEGIAASHDCTVGELAKLNKMHSRMVFAGQHIMVPAPTEQSSDYSLIPTSSPPHKASNASAFSEYNFPDNPAQSTDFIKPPGHAVRQDKNESDASNVSMCSRQDSTASGQTSGQFDHEDTDCLRRFLKIKVKQVTESDGTVTGTLLITPNCIMFDPDLMHPLVKENGPDLYGMVANMDDIVSVSVFKHSQSLVGADDKERDQNKLSFECGPTEDEYRQNLSSDSADVFTDSEATSLNEEADPSGANPPVTLTMSKEQQLPSIEEEGHLKGQTPDTPANPNALTTGETKLRSVSDAGILPSSEASSPRYEDMSQCDRPRAHSDLQPSSSLDSSQQKSGLSRFSPNMTRRSFGRLGRTLSNRANSIKGTVTSGAQTISSGTQKMAHGVVTHTKSAADHIQTGIQTGAKAVAAVPSSIANVGSGILHEGQDLYGSFVAELKGEQPKSPLAMKKERSRLTLETLKQKTHQARISSLAKDMDVMFSMASANDELAELLKEPKLVGQAPIIGTPPDPPHYMTIRVDRKRMTKKRKINYDDVLGATRHASVSSASDQLDQPAFGNKRRCEFWFAIPPASAEAIYHFLLIWSPGQNSLEDDNNDENKGHIGGKKGLIILDSSSDDSRVTSSNYIDDGCWFNSFGVGLMREWEIITVRELCRRLSLDEEYDASETPLPEGSLQSQILDEFMIRQIAEILPPRAEGYPWQLIYNSEKHGFSLTTLYRKMEPWTDEMSPMLIIIRDVQGHVFGAMTSHALKLSDHYYGTADACFLFRFTGKVPHTRELRHYEWTGDNQFFINSSKDSLSIGAGSGHAGLWLDADLNHGRSQRCKTFDNEPLAGGSQEDFVVQFVEVYGFSM